MNQDKSVKPLKTFLRGGQVTLHTLRMFGQVIGVMVTIWFITSIAITWSGVAKNTTTDERYYAYKYYEAYVYEQIGDPNKTELNILGTNGQSMTYTVRQIRSSSSIQTYEKSFRKVLWKWVGIGVAGGAVVFFVIIILFMKRGGLLTLTNFRRGAQQLKPNELKLLIGQYNKKKRREHRALMEVPSYTLAGIPYPVGSEVQHTSISGTIGAGKTQAINELLDQIRKNGDRAVVFDLTGSFIGPFYRDDKDIILNPLDERSPRWSIFEEAKGKIGFDAIASAMIEGGKHGDPVWADSARMVFSTAAQLLKGDNKATNKDLMETLLTAPLGQLETFFQGTPAAAIISTDSARMANSVRMMLSTYLDCLRLLPEEGNGFSVTKWIEDDEEDATLFLSSRADMHETLKPLLTVWMDTAVRALMARERDPSRRIWFILDEVAALQELPSIMDGLARGRQFGAAFVLGLQAQSQLRAIYGQDGAQSLSSVCRTKLILSASDADTATWYADFLGRQETVRALENTSFGANTIRDGVSVNRQEKLEHLIIPEEIMNLRSLEGYIKMSEGFPLAKVKIRLVIRQDMNQPFKPREAMDSLIRRQHTQKDVPEMAETSPTANVPDWAKKETTKPKGGNTGVDLIDLMTGPGSQGAVGDIIDMETGEVMDADKPSPTNEHMKEAGSADMTTEKGRQRSREEATNSFPDHLEI